MVRVREAAGERFTALKVYSNVYWHGVGIF